MNIKIIVAKQNFCRLDRFIMLSSTMLCLPEACKTAHQWSVHKRTKFRTNRRLV